MRMRRGNVQLIRLTAGPHLCRDSAGFCHLYHVFFFWISADQYCQSQFTYINTWRNP